MSRLLIVDDSEQNLYMLQVLLCANGFSGGNRPVTVRRHWKLARANPPDMIVLIS